MLRVTRAPFELTEGCRQKHPHSGLVPVIMDAANAVGLLYELCLAHSRWWSWKGGKVFFLEQVIFDFILVSLEI